MIARNMVLQDMDRGKHNTLGNIITSMSNSDKINPTVAGVMRARLQGLFGIESTYSADNHVWWPMSPRGDEQRALACEILSELPDYEVKYVVDKPYGLPRGLAKECRLAYQYGTRDRDRARAVSQIRAAEHREWTERATREEYEQRQRERAAAERSQRYMPVPVALRTADGLIAYTTVPSGLVQGPNYGGAKIQRGVQYPVPVRASYALADTAPMPLSRIYIHRGEQHTVEYTGSRIPLFIEEL
jgi:hypothetical protein